MNKDDRHIIKSHNKNLLLYHIVCPAKYRRKIFTEEVTKTLKEICLKMSECYQIYFLEIGTDEDHTHFLVQSVPTYSPTRIVTVIKSITARELFARHKEIKKMLWGGELWTDGYYMNTVGQYNNLGMIENYVRNQGRNYTKIYQAQQKLFEV